jgi:ribosome-associated heat shock protein Hsp15
VLTLMVGGSVRVIELVALPTRRGPPAAAQLHYREVDQFREVDGGGLDPKAQFAVAPTPRATGTQPGASEA